MNAEQQQAYEDGGFAALGVESDRRYELGSELGNFFLKGWINSPSSEVRQGLLKRAAEMLAAYSEIVKMTGAYAQEHYLPQVQFVISELAALTQNTEKP